MCDLSCFFFCLEVLNEICALAENQRIYNPKYRKSATEQDIVPAPPNKLNWHEQWLNACRRHLRQFQLPYAAATKQFMPEAGRGEMIAEFSEGNKY